ncbi:hypothetical protein FE773_05120 [Caminibacter mediatlanticus TB-2]|uniref:Ferrochelatase n=1 Tax=Caminibacter mediatlanticus TB-2 TaxID=391592 RepID=A0AAI9F1Z4_9BACT|nr:hypothetical protein [Caminibacter mediatlanticus]EDM23061.1 hypothetical protein CMTB2_00414 [Caminibacter mediatlanticus TB-2]QCT94577.1 hypothetical protein FE773_05120 [Caminibacter mediatlanticus TB-2]
MKIETLVNLIDGELLNRPFISEVVNFTKDIDKVSRGSCFFAEDESLIPFAIKNGAYAIIVSKDTKILDKEIAWIKVDDFKKAIFKIFKYENLKHKIYLADKITLKLIKAMNLDKKVVILENEEDFLKAINLTNKFLLMDNKKKNIFPNKEELKSISIELEMINLFKSRYKKEEINLPFVYKNSFSKAINFFESNNLKYTLEFEIDRFKPVFVDSFLREVEYGSSDRVLITGIQNDEIFFDELNYLIENTKHAKTIVVDKNREELLTHRFNFAMIVGFDVKLNEKEEKGLFDD